MIIENPDPRVHFALVCGARSCPPIAAYEAERLDQQLDQAANTFIAGGGAQYEPDSRTLSISRIFKWYQRDFGGRQGVLDTIAKHLSSSSDLSQARVRYQSYDWSVNAVT